MSIFQILPSSFSAFNCAPQLIKATVDYPDDDSIVISGSVTHFDHAWYKVGARGPKMPAVSCGFIVDAVPVSPLGSYAIGLRGESSIYAAHFICSSGSLHKINLLQNVYSSWSFDREGLRKQSGLAAPWEAVGRHHTIGVFYDDAKKRFHSTIDGIQVHERQATADSFYPVVRVEAVGVDGPFEVRFENMRIELTDGAAPEVLQRFGAWASDFAPVFVSYAHDDAQLVTPFRDELRRCGVRVLGDWDFRPGDSLLKRIASSIKRAGNVLVCLSPNAVASKWVQQELEIATSMEVQDRSLCVIPIVVSSCEIPPFLRAKLYHDVRPPNSLVSDQLLASLRAKTW